MAIPSMISVKRQAIGCTIRMADSVVLAPAGKSNVADCVAVKSEATDNYERTVLRRPSAGEQLTGVISDFDLATGAAFAKSKDAKIDPLKCAQRDSLDNGCG
jgi:hypothetical protein